MDERVNYIYRIYSILMCRYRYRLVVKYRPYLKTSLLFKEDLGRYAISFPKKWKCLIVDIDVDNYRYNCIYIVSLRSGRQNSHLRRTTRNCPGYRVTNQRSIFNHNITISSSAMKTLILLIIIFPVLLARNLQHQVRSICSHSSVACLTICIIIYKNNILKYCDLFYFPENF